MAIATALRPLDINSHRTADPAEAEEYLRDTGHKLLVADLDLGTPSATSAFDLIDNLDRNRPDVLPVILTDASKEFEKRFARLN